MNEEQSNPDLQEHSIALRSLRVSSTFDAPHIITGASSLLGHHTILAFHNFDKSLSIPYPFI